MRVREARKGHEAQGQATEGAVTPHFSGGGRGKWEPGKGLELEPPEMRASRGRE